MHDDGAGDFQIQRADAHAIGTISRKKISGIGVPREDSPRGEEINTALQPPIRDNLAMRIRQAMNLSQPPTKLLLHGDNRRCDFLTGRVDPLQKGRCGRRRKSQDRDMVCIKNQQSLFGRFAVLGTRVPAAPPPLSSRHPPTYRLSRANLFCAASRPEPARVIQRILFPDIPHVFPAFATWL